MSPKNILLDSLLEDIVFTVFDTETTGDNSKNLDKPIEIAAVPWNLKNGFLDKPWERLVDPQMLIHPSAIAVHGILDSDVKGKPLWSEIEPEFLSYIKGTVLLAHNISFDLNMLPILKDLDNPKIDTLRFARHIFKIGDLNDKGQDLRSHKSQELRYWLGLEVDTMGLQAHRAAADILVTGEVFHATLKQFIATTYSETLQDLLDFVNAPILSEKMVFGKYKGVLLQEAIATEIKNPKNYFSWLLRSVHNGDMVIDEDLKYSIEYYLKKHDIDPMAFLIEEPKKTWKDVATQTKPKMR
jgi:DNA polymerase III epsilon subunit family exonuclease